MKFWLENPKELLSNLEIIPTTSMSNDDKLNALTRLALVVAIVLFIMGRQQQAAITLIAGVVLVLLIYNLFVKSKEGYVYPRKFGNTIYEPAAKPPGQNGLPSYVQELTPELQDWVNDINSGRPQVTEPPMLSYDNQNSQTLLGDLIAPADPEYLPFSKDEAGTYKKQVPMGEYLHSQAQQHTSRMNDQMNHIQREKMYRVQRTMNRHMSNPNGLPEFGLNVDFPEQGSDTELISYVPQDTGLNSMNYF